MNQFTLAIHGGAGTISPKSMTSEKEIAYRAALNNALQAGYKILSSKGSSLDAVEAAIISLENNPLFNAGRGSVFTHDGGHEMDASIMNGKNLEAGSVAGVRGIKNPIVLSRAVMEKSEFVMLCRDGAEEFGRLQNIDFESDEYFYDELRHNQWKEAVALGVVQLDHTEDKKFGTVGAVAMDVYGNLAAGTSTGGMTNKRWARLGDSPVIGAGTYANNNTCAISCTGHGEFFIRAVVAYDISCLIEYRGLSLEEACKLVVNDKLVKFGGEGGIIAADAKGKISMPFNSEGMYRGFVTSEDSASVSIYKD